MPFIILVENYILLILNSMCAITDFKINNILTNSSWEEYLQFIKEASNYVRVQEKFSNNDVLFIEQVLPYYQMVKNNPNFDTKAINMGNEPVLKEACQLAVELNKDFNTLESQIFEENMLYAYKMCFETLTDISFRSNLN